MHVSRFGQLLKIVQTVEEIVFLSDDYRATSSLVVRMNAPHRTGIEVSAQGVPGNTR